MPISNGAWVFVSHSHLDLEKVRQIRNELERLGHKPLLFYLKALEDNDARLPRLLKDEIEARTWFVLCDSETAEKSPWVTEERRIVESLVGRKGFCVRIDVDKDIEPQYVELEKLSKRATVFISYSRGDVEISEAIYNRLSREDYRVFWDRKSVQPGDRWVDTIQTAIADAVNLGFVLLLLSPEYLQSRWGSHEREYAFAVLGSRKQTNIVPVIVRDRDAVTALLPENLRDIQFYDLASRRMDIELLIQELKRRPMV